MKKNNLVATEKDPTAHIKLPCDILRDLALRAEENGHSIEFEISIRLSRSLERDLEMIDEDNLLALLAFEEFQRQQAKKEGK